MPDPDPDADNPILLDIKSLSLYLVPRHSATVLQRCGTASPLGTLVYLIITQKLAFLYHIQALFITILTSARQCIEIFHFIKWSNVCLSW